MSTTENEMWDGRPRPIPGELYRFCGQHLTGWDHEDNRSTLRCDDIVLITSEDHNLVWKRSAPGADGKWYVSDIWVLVDERIMELDDVPVSFWSDWFEKVGA